MYNVGDKVIISTNHNNRGSCGQYGCAYYNSEGSMNHYMGKVATIIRLNIYGTNNRYKLDIDSGVWAWSDCMLEPYTARDEVRYIPKKEPRKIKENKRTSKINYDQFKLGIELETIVPFEYEEETENLAGNCNFDVDSDGSITTNSEGIGVEFKGARPMKYEQLIKNTQELCKGLKEYGVYVNNSCGFHLHFSNEKFFDDKIMNRIIFTWSAIEDFLLATQPQSRLNNTYCQRYLLQYVKDQRESKVLRKGKEALIDQLENIDRYKTLNLSALADHGTIEIRLHAGTTRSEKIIQWIDLLMCFFTYCIKDYKHRDVMELFNTTISNNKVEDVMCLLGLDESQKNYFRGRIQTLLFQTLVKQQDAAGKIVKNIKVVQKAQKAFNKAKETLTRTNATFSQDYQILQSR